MEPTTLFRDEDAVSPVVGVVLLLGITVVLGAIAGVYFFALTDTPTQQPSVDFEYNYDRVVLDCDTLVVIHDGGDTLDASRTTLRMGNESNSTANLGVGSEFTAGESISIDGDHPAKSGGGYFPCDMGGETLRIVWEHPENGDSFVIGKYEVPS